MILTFMHDCDYNRLHYYSWAKSGINGVFVMITKSIVFSTHWCIYVPVRYLLSYEIIDKDLSYYDYINLNM